MHFAAHMFYVVLGALMAALTKQSNTLRVCMHGISFLQFVRIRLWKLIYKPSFWNMLWSTFCTQTLEFSSLFLFIVLFPFSKLKLSSSLKYSFMSSCCQIHSAIQGKWVPSFQANQKSFIQKTPSTLNWRVFADLYLYISWLWMVTLISTCFNPSEKI